MFNKLKAITHKQSKYFTIMLIPESSSKTRSIKIPLLAFYIVLGTVLVTLLTIAIFVIATNHFKLQAYNAAIWLEQSQEEKVKLLEQTNEEKSRLIQESQNLSWQLKSEKANTEKTIKSQTASFEEKLKYYEEKAIELQEQIDELNRAKEDIYNQLSSKNYLPKIEHVSTNIPAAQSAFMSLTQASDLDNLDDVYAKLDSEIDQQKLTYNHLLGQMAKIKPLLLNYPTIWPVTGRITSEFSNRSNPFTGSGSEFHGAMDISVPVGTSVKATGGGTVSFSGVQSGYGYIVIIDHGQGIQTKYAHNSQLLVKKGQRVERGDIIAKSGNTGRSTGPHVHYEVRVNGVAKNPREFLY